MSHCHPITGVCSSGCLPGWTGDLCTSKMLFDLDLDLGKKGTGKNGTGKKVQKWHGYVKKKVETNLMRLVRRNVTNYLLNLKIV